jgi:hypothetical protein
MLYNDYYEKKKTARLIINSNRQDIHQYTSIVMGGAMAIGVVSLAVGICGVVACSKWKFPVRKWKTIFIMVRSPNDNEIFKIVVRYCFTKPIFLKFLQRPKQSIT